MITFILQAFSTFFICLEIILFVYLLCSWMGKGGNHKNWILYQKQFQIIVDPILIPIRYLMKHSVIYSPMFDLSPVIAIVLMMYLQQLLYRLQ